MNDSMDPRELNKLIAENKERLKELSCINQTSAIIKEGKSIEETLQKIVLIIPKAWQYPDYAVSRIQFGGINYLSPGFVETEWGQKQLFQAIDGEEGSIEVFIQKIFQNYMKAHS
jgi:hypothetical protein